MRTRTVLSAGAVAALALIGPGLAIGGNSSPAAAPRCPPAAAHLLARGRIMRVYRTGAGPSQGAVEACLAGRRGHMTLLGARGPGLGGRSLSVAASSGPLLAYLVTSFGVDSGATALLVADVQARRVIRELPAGHYVDAGIAGYERVEKVALGPEGAVGWISASSEGRQRPVSYIVHGAATIGEPRVLDEGPDIGPTSLTLSGRTLHWWHAGTERSAPLP